MATDSIFCDGAVRKHNMAQRFKCELNDISERDYSGKNYFPKGILSLDLDGYEKSLSKSSPDATVDSAVGIANVSGARIAKERLLLVELRMDYKNGFNLQLEKIEQKERHSRDILLGDVMIDDRLFLLFEENIVQRATYVVRRNHRNKNWQVESNVAFCRLFQQTEEDISIADFDERINLLKNLLCNGNTNDYERELNEIMDVLLETWCDAKYRRVVAICDILIESMTKATEMITDEDCVARIVNKLSDVFKYKAKAESRC